MSFNEILSKENVQNKIDKLANKLRNKKIIIYGAGQFSREIFDNYDLSKLNIIAVADKKFTNEKNRYFYNLNCIPPEEIKEIDCDIVLIANYDVNYFKKIIKKFIINNKNNIKILPLIKITTRKIPYEFLFRFLSNSINSRKIATNIINILAKFSTFYIFDKKKKYELFLEKQTKIMTSLYGYDVLKNAKSIGENFWCGGFSTVNKNTVLKNNVNFNGLKIMGEGKVTIGNYFHSGIEVLIIAQNHNYDNGNAIPYDDSYIYKDIEISDFVWLGSRVTILPGTKIGEGAIIQAGAVVHGEIPPYAIAGGNPAKVFKYRDIEHFKKLKAENKFY